MGLRIATVRNQRSAGATATSLVEDINFAFNAHSIHQDVFCYKDAGTAATVQNLIDKITSIRLITQGGNPESVIDGDDMHDMLPLVFGTIPYVSILTSTDNIPHGFGLQFPLSPFWNDPLKNFGMPGGQGIQYQTDFAADVSQDFDGYVYDLTVEGVDTADKPASNGYVRITQDAYTSGAVGEIRKTIIAPAKRILGVYNFMTTSFDDLAAAAAFDVTGIREQGIAFSDNTLFSNKPSRSWSMKLPQTVATFAAAAAVINVLDDGRWFNDYGITNSGSVLGIAYQNNASVKTTAGVAEATRVNVLSLV
jgi:hypothetical protein